MVNGNCNSNLTSLKMHLFQPPKTSAKAIAAEIKKKNTAEAKDIVATMKRTAQKNKPSSEMASKTAISERLFGSSSTVEMAKTGNSDAVANVRMLNSLYR